MRKRRQGQLVCAMCDQAYPDDAFRPIVRRGKTYRDCYCIPCRRAYHRELMRAWYRTPHGKAIVTERVRCYQARKSAEHQRDRVWKKQFTAQALDRLISAGLDRREIADGLGVALSTIYRWHVDGTLPQRATFRRLRRFADAVAPFITTGQARA